MNMIGQNVSPNIPHQTRILVVDDHPTTALTLARAISTLGSNIEVISATSGRMALEKVKDGAVDLLITDMMMPDMNGLELIESLKSHPGGCPTHTILITAYDVPGLRESARRLKVNETIIKPVRPERICQLVNEALGAMEQPSQPQKPADASRPYKILIADDVPDNVLLLARYLQGEGYTHITASNGVEALEKTRQEMPDLILLDVNMPKMDGFKVLQEIRADPAIEHIPVIVLTAARISHADVQSGLTLGADDYVTKPFDRRELLARIHTRLRVKEAEDVIRRRNKELSVLPEIGRELSALTDINELADIVLKRTVESLGAMVGHIIVFNPKGPLHKEYHLSPIDIGVSQIQLPPLNDFLNQIRETRQGLIIHDAGIDPRWQMMPNDPTRSVVMIPMFGRSELVGLLLFNHEQAGYFNMEHQLLLQAIASQAAIAVENAQLYARLAKEQQQLSAVLKSAADAILMFDVDGCLSLLNPAAEKLFKDYEAGTGLPLVRGHGYDALIVLLEDVLTSRQSKTGEISWHDERVFAALLTPIEEGGCVAVLHDVSHFKTLERVKNEFIATASHDLKNPIATITGFSELVSRTGPLTEQQADFVRRIQSASASMNELVENMLDLASIDAGMKLKQDVVDINSLMTEIADEFEPQANTKEQTLVFKMSESAPRILGDLFQWKQVLRNLVGNAVKYTPNGGSITLYAEIQNSETVIRVMDTGYGIPSKDLPFIFDRFYRVRDDSVKGIEGNGLGLAIVKSIVEKHGGRIDVESETGKGSCFIVALPVLHNEPVKTDGSNNQEITNQKTSTVIRR